MWFIYVIISSFFVCAYYFGNQIAKLTPNVFMFYRGFAPVLLLLPFLPFMTMIPVWQFYAFCVLQGLVIAYIDYRNFRAMHVWGAEAVSSLHPLGIGIVFVMWLLLKPHNIVFYAENLWLFMGIISALGGIIYATASFRYSHRSNKLIKYLVPYFLVAALCDIINKQCMSYVSSELLPYASYFYILITGAVVALINLTIYIKNNNKIKDLYVIKNLKYMPLIALLVGSMACKNFAMFQVSNPAFVTATLYLYIILIMIIGSVLEKYGKGTKFRIIERKKAILLLICAVSLVLLER